MSYLNKGEKEEDDKEGTDRWSRIVGEGGKVQAASKGCVYSLRVEAACTVYVYRLCDKFPSSRVFE